MTENNYAKNQPNTKIEAYQSQIMSKMINDSKIDPLERADMIGSLSIISSAIVATGFTYALEKLPCLQLTADKIDTLLQHAIQKYGMSEVMMTGVATLGIGTYILPAIYGYISGKEKKAKAQKYLETHNLQSEKSIESLI